MYWSNWINPSPLTFNPKLLAPDCINNMLVVLCAVRVNVPSSRSSNLVPDNDSLTVRLFIESVSPTPVGSPPGKVNSVNDMVRDYSSFTMELSEQI